VEEQSVATQQQPVGLRRGAPTWWLRTVVIYVVVMYAAWTGHDIAGAAGGFEPSMLLSGLYTALFTFVLFGISSLFMVGVVRLVEPKMSRRWFAVLAVLVSLLPLLLAPEASGTHLLLQTPAQLSLVIMLLLGRLHDRAAG
jgi:hypothetical protein